MSYRGSTAAAATRLAASPIALLTSAHCELGRCSLQTRPSQLIAADDDAATPAAATTTPTPGGLAFEVTIGDDDEATLESSLATASAKTAQAKQKRVAAGNGADDDEDDASVMLSPPQSVAFNIASLGRLPQSTATATASRPAPIVRLPSGALVQIAPPAATHTLTLARTATATAPAASPYPAPNALPIDSSAAAATTAGKQRCTFWPNCTKVCGVVETVQFESVFDF